MNTYLNVSFNDKDLAKKYGAKFDFTKNLWYIPPNISEINKNTLLEKWVFKKINLIGEDRNYGGNDLFVDLIPKSCWFKNVRSNINSSDWNLIRKHIYNRVNYICECCGIDTKLNKKQLEAHERWHYDNKNKIQKLVRIIALCRDCHQSTHIGYAEITGNYQKAYNHLKKVRDFDDIDCEDHINRAFELWEKRNKYNWELDLSLITNNGFRIKK